MIHLLVLRALAVPVATPTEEAALLGGATVVRPLAASADTAVKVLGMVDVRAEASQVWEVLLDFPARKASNPSLTSLVAYRPATATEQWWAFTVQKFGTTTVYHNRYAKVGDRLIHELDTTQQNDIAGNTGVYELGPCAAGAPSPCTRLYWTVETDFGRALPGMIKSWLGRTAVENFLGDIAARAPRY